MCINSSQWMKSFNKIEILLLLPVVTMFSYLKIWWLKCLFNWSVSVSLLLIISGKATHVVAESENFAVEERELENLLLKYEQHRRYLPALKAIWRWEPLLFNVIKSYIFIYLPMHQSWGGAICSLGP